MLGSLLYFLLWAGAIFFMMRFGCGAHVMGHGHGHSDSHSSEPSDAANPSNSASRWAAPEVDMDPVCHMQVQTAKAKSSVYEGRLYHFCSQDCRAKFEAEPATYSKAAGDTPPAKEHHHAC